MDMTTFSAFELMPPDSTATIASHAEWNKVRKSSRGLPFASKLQTHYAKKWTDTISSYDTISC
jgi:hypothetical protein